MKSQRKWPQTSRMRRWINFQLPILWFGLTWSSLSGPDCINHDSKVLRCSDQDFQRLLSMKSHRKCPYTSRMRRWDSLSAANLMIWADLVVIIWARSHNPMILRFWGAPAQDFERLFSMKSHRKCPYTSRMRRWTHLSAAILMILSWTGSSLSGPGRIIHDSKVWGAQLRFWATFQHEVTSKMALTRPEWGDEPHFQLQI